IVGFIPFHLIKAIGVPAGAIVAVHITAVGVLAWVTRRPVPTPPMIRASILILQLYPALLLVLLPPSEWPAKAAAMLAAVAGMAVIGSSRADSATALPCRDADNTPAPTAGSPRQSGT